MRATLIIGVLLGVGSLSSSVLAEDAVKKLGPGRYEIKVDIVAKPPRPMAAVTVTRLEPKSTLTPLRQPLLDRIEQAIEKSPF